MSFLTERFFQLLETHKIYERMNDEASLKHFVESHIVCVWIYNYLLRDLHKEVAQNLQPLSSGEQKEATRLIAELILEEEVEEQEDGSLMSHMEIYLESMQDLGADVGPIMSFLDMLESGISLADAIDKAGFPEAAQHYLQKLSECFLLPLHQRAAVLFYEGEPYIPDSFLTKLGNMSANIKVSRLLDYFERHIEGLKRPGFSAIGRIVELFCGDDEVLNLEAEARAESVMKLRHELWSSLLDQLGDQSSNLLKRGKRSNLRLITTAV